MAYQFAVFHDGCGGKNARKATRAHDPKGYIAPDSKVNEIPCDSGVEPSGNVAASQKPEQ